MFRPIEQLMLALGRYRVDRQRKRSPRVNRKLAMEAMESRTLLAVSNVVLHANSGILEITGTDDRNVVGVDEPNPSTITVSVSGPGPIQTHTFAKSAITSIAFYGNDGSDDFVNTTNVPSVVDGGGGNDRLQGGSGNDVIIGAAGNDVLAGHDGNDQIWGNDGDDQLQGGRGADTLWGGEGLDVLGGDVGDDVLSGDAGADRLSGGDGNDKLYGGAGRDRLDGGTGQDELRGGEENDSLYGGAGNDILFGDRGDDRLEGGSGANLLRGGPDNDTLLGGDDSDHLYGEQGRDRLYGNAGNDSLEGGHGEDFLNGGTGDDVLDGQEGNDELLGGDGTDRLVGGLGDDQLRGGSGRDRLDGHDGDDLLEGGDGADQLYGNAGNDRLFGHEGNDRIEGGDGNDRLDGGAGNDVLTGQEGNDELLGGDGTDRLAGGLGDDQLTGGLGDDRLDGHEGNDLLEGGDGADQLYGNAGNDRLFGHEGNDRIEGGDGNDRLSGGAGNDVLTGQEGNDELLGGDGTDRLAGGPGDDQLSGGLGGDRLDGHEGNDLLEGDDGADLLYGNAGNDRLFGHEGNDRLEGGTGSDYLHGGSDDDIAIGGDGDDQLLGADGRDYLYGDGGRNSLEGGSGDDYLQGGNNNDTLLGGLGNDLLYGRGGEDLLYGDEGSDRLDGGFGNDLLNGGNGDDTLLGGAGNDSLLGFAGNDNLLGGDGTDELTGGSGNDVLAGNGGPDALYAGDGNDVAIGGTGADTIYSGQGENILVGGSTVYDNDVTTLRKIANYWNNGNGFEARVHHLRTPEALPFELTMDDTVYDDQIRDQLWGGSDQDWILVTGANYIYDPFGLAAPHETTTSDTGHAHHSSSSFVGTPPELEGFALVDSVDKLNSADANDVVTTQLPHFGDRLRFSEHLSLFQLVRYEDVTHIAISSGSWADPASWADGVVPREDARVLIPVGVNITIDRQISHEVFSIRVDGTLSFATNVNTELRVDTLVVSDVGHFEMGTDTQPIQDGVTARLLFTDSGAIDRTWDPFGISRGLITHGSVEIVGSEKSSHHEALQTLPAGTRFVALDRVPTNWQVGDEIVIAGTTAGADQDELREILAINGAVVEVAPLSFSHVSPSSSMRVHVANVTRNAVLTSEATETPRRGHTMFMHNRDVTIRYAGFYGLGRTDKSIPIDDPMVDIDWQLTPGTGTNGRARYAIHFHRNGASESGTPSLVDGTVVAGSAGWGYVNHSSYVNVTNSVAYDVLGAAFTTETGEEVGLFRGNISIHTPGSGDAIESRLRVNDFGHAGHGFWLQGPGVEVVDNVAVGANGSGYIYYMIGLRENGVTTHFDTANLLDPSIAKGAESMLMSEVPNRPFSDNVAYASDRGLTVQYVLRDAVHNTQALFENSIFWNNNTGVETSYSKNTTFRNTIVVHDPSDTPMFGVSRNIVTRNLTFENVVVVGYQYGVWVPRSGNTMVDGGFFANRMNFFEIGPFSSDYELTILDNVVQQGLPS